MPRQRPINTQEDELPVRSVIFRHSVVSSWITRNAKPVFKTIQLCDVHFWQTVVEAIGMPSATDVWLVVQLVGILRVECVTTGRLVPIWNVHL
jgi:hypothetical protein